MDKEIWKDIPEYEGYYQASNMGRVRSVDRTVVDSRGQERFLKGRILEGSVHKNTGYRQFRLYVNGEGRTFTASQMVVIAFLGHSVNGHAKVIDHVNGVKTDDRLSNLRIVTQRENSSTCFRSDRDSLSSKFMGVSWSKNNSKWQAHIQYEGELIYLGLFNTELEASEVYQKALARIKDGTFNPDEYKPKWSSSHKGVGFHKNSNKWQAYARINGKRKYLGLYPTELEAYTALQEFKKNNIQ